MKDTALPVFVAALLLIAGGLPSASHADESLLGYVKGAETLPKGSWELYQVITRRTGKSEGHYDAWNLSTEVEHGITDRLTAKANLKFQSVDVEDLLVDGYLPKDESYGLRVSGAELAVKYMFLSPAISWMGLSGQFSLDYNWLDPHSGQDKDTVSAESMLILQKYFLEGQLVWMNNFGLETTYAERDRINNLPPGFEWPTDPEMEIELKYGMGLSYRFAPRWFLDGHPKPAMHGHLKTGHRRA